MFFCKYSRCAILVLKRICAHMRLQAVRQTFEDADASGIDLGANQESETASESIYIWFSQMFWGFPLARATKLIACCKNPVSLKKVYLSNANGRIEEELESVS